jgi:hypothetical protein
MVRTLPHGKSAVYCYKVDTAHAIGLVSGVDLTFATIYAACSQSECQILNSTRILYLLVVL